MSLLQSVKKKTEKLKGFELCNKKEQVIFIPLKFGCGFIVSKLENSVSLLVNSSFGR